VFTTLAAEAVTSRLRDSVPWSPLDFIKGISPAGDRAVHVGAVTRPIAPADDLRLTCPIAGDVDVAVCAERLPWDSSFFGYGIARLHGIFPLMQDGYRASADYTRAVSALVELAKGRGISYLFGVIDARDLPTIRALTARGFSLIETRLHFHRSLPTYDYPRRFRCRTATEADLPTLTALARSVENPYDRFNADPFIERGHALRLMETWIRASVVEGFADATFIPDAPTPGALCTVKYHRDKAAAWGTSIAQLVLAMAAPRTGNRLLGLISEVTYHLRDLDIEHVFFSTQVANRRAIRVGEHLGYRFGRGEYVFRLLL
jgi:dTDP-4-amino-4,6-dideoxy-D-galactose acyltransferase